MECPIVWIYDGVLHDLYGNHELSFFTFSALNCTRKSEFGQSNISMDHHGTMYCLAYILATKISDIFKTISTWCKENVQGTYCIWKYARTMF